MAPQDVNAERETDWSKQEKDNETAQSNEELQSSGCACAEEGGSETTQGGQNTNSLQVEEEEKHAMPDKHNQHDGDEEIQDPCEGNKTTKSTTTTEMTGSEEAESGQDIRAPLAQTKNVDDNRNET